jgi:hypothetical protein
MIVTVHRGNQIYQLHLQLKREAMPGRSSVPIASNYTTHISFEVMNREVHHSNDMCVQEIIADMRYNLKNKLKTQFIL